MAGALPLRRSPALRSVARDRARLQLVDTLLASNDAELGASATLAWLIEHTSASRGLCAVIDEEDQRLVPIATQGLPVAALESWSIELSDIGNGFVQALVGSSPVHLRFAAGRPGAVPPGLEDAYVVPLLDGDERRGILALATAGPFDRETTAWAAELLSMRFARLWLRRVQSRERRQRRELTRLFGIIEAVVDPILLTDHQGRILIANHAAERLLTVEEGMSEGRMRAVTLNNMLFSASLFTAGEDAKASRRELPLVDPIDGQDLLFELLSTSFEIAPNETGMVSILRNVTDLRRAAEEIQENYRRLRIAESKTRAERERLDLILDAVLDPILVTDSAGNIVRMNPPAERMFMVSELAGRGATAEAERRLRANDAVFTSFISNLYTGQDLRWRGELALTDLRSGAAVPFEAISGKVLSRQGDTTAVVTILHDLSEAAEKARLYEQVKRHSEELRERVREATAELAEQNELLRRQALELEQASAMKSQFLANVSHELRTPLNAIVGYTALMIEGVGGEVTTGQREKLSRVESNARHLLAIINDLLDIARIEAGKLPIKIERFELSQLVDEVLIEVDPLIPTSNLQVVREVPAGLPALRTDRQKVKQILLNLLSNAIKFTPAGRVTIRTEHDRRGDRMRIAVADSGVGISPANQERIFEAYQRSESSYARPQAGTGLGLTICRRLATVLGGTIVLESAVGVGSTFTLSLPRRAPRS